MEKLRQYFQKHMPHGASSKKCWKFGIHSFHIKQKFCRQTYTGKKGEVVYKNEEITSHFNNTITLSI